MEKLPMCRICLVKNVRMFVVVNRNWQELYEKLTDFPFVTEDRRPILACFFCCAKLNQCYRLLRQCLEAEELFAQMMNEDYEPNPLINQDHSEFYSGFIKSPIVHVSIDDECETERDDPLTESIVFKEELPAVCEGLDDIIEPKEEHQSGELELENLDNSCLYVADITPHHSESDSEDDEPLTECKIDVEKEQDASRLNKKPRGRQANINIEARATIIALHKSGLNKTQIAEETRLNRNTVSLWIKRYEEEGSLASRQRSGRPLLISEAQRRYMVGEYETNGFIPTGHFAELFYTSLETVRRSLHTEGLYHRRPAKKPFLSERHKQERLRFARDHLDFDWSTTIFSDERTFMSSQKGRLRLLRKDNTRWYDKNVIPNTESGRITINMWGWMSAAGPGELAFIPPRANSSTYVEVLDDVMLPTVREIYPADELTQLTFVQDNCPIHRASIVRKWFQNHPEIIVIPWPVRSADLNPIENLWDLMVQRWRSRDERCIQQLKTHCMEVWENLRGTEICDNIVGSMRKRLLDCIKNNGGYTKY